ncbi:hypothetical protein A2U01_0053474, partial [Trifolium medium]|nr:hypothetical protein [Trifolium medium]
MLSCCGTARVAGVA